MQFDRGYASACMEPTPKNASGMTTLYSYNRQEDFINPRYTSVEQVVKTQKAAIIAEDVEGGRSQHWY